MTRCREQLAAGLLVCALLGHAVTAAAEPTAVAAGASRPSAAAVEQALAQLAASDWLLQSEAIARLAQWQTPEAIAPLTALVNDQQPPWRAGAALVALARLSGPNVRAQAVALADAPAPELRGAATEALGIIGGPEALAAVQRRLTDADPQVRYRAAAVYAGRRGKDAWPELAPLLENPPTEALEQAARALGQIGTAESRARLQALLAPSAAAGHAAVLFGLKDARDPDLVPLLLQYLANLPAKSEMANPCLDLLQSYGADFLARPLVEVFHTAKPNVWVAACRLLYAHPATEPAMALAEALEKTRYPADELVLAALAALSTPKACPARHTALFTRYLTHHDPKCRAKAAACLGLNATAESYPVLRGALADADSAVCRSALLALSRLPPESAPQEGIVSYLSPVLARKGPPDFEILRLAFNLLATRGKPEEFPAALAALNPLLTGKDLRLRGAVAAALRQLGGQANARQLALTQSYLLDWMLIGTFLNDEKNSGLTTVYPPETEINFQASYVAPYVWTGLEAKNVADRRATGERQVSWQRWAVAEYDGRVILRDVLPPPATFSVGYGVSEITAPAAKAVTLAVTTTGPFGLWLNGAKLAESTETRTTTVPVPANLKEGENRLLIKSCIVKGEWWFSIQLREAEAGAPKKTEGK